jgi:hypothetical protein
MVALCTHHHRFVHEYGYQLEIREDGEVVFTDPRGRVVPCVPESPRPVAPGFPALRAEHLDLAITADTPACGWDGTRVDYGLVIDGLVRIDDLASPRERAS